MRKYGILTLDGKDYDDIRVTVPEDAVSRMACIFCGQRLDVPGYLEDLNKVLGTFTFL